MPRFGANLTLLFRELPFVDRFEAARRAGFDAVELQFPYDLPAAELAVALADSGLPLEVFNLPAGDLLEGGDGWAGVPGREHDFTDGIERTREYAARLRPRCLNVLPGRVPHGGTQAACEALFTEQLGHAVATFGGAHTVVVEALNHHDQPRILFADHAVLQAYLAKHAPQVKTQYDVYHQVRMGRDVLADLRRGFHAHDVGIGHVQFADVPGRNEPGTGDVDFQAVFAALDASGFAGAAGAEYVPRADTVAGLGWLAAARAATPAS